MSRILTQEEVDALLGNEPVVDGDPRGGGASPSDKERFDLRSPLIAAGERLDVLRGESELVAPAFGLELGQILGLEVEPQAAFEDLSQPPARKLLGELGQGTALGLVEDHDGQVVGGVVLEASLTALLLDRLQGGRGSEAAARARVSDIDRALLRVVLSRLVKALSRALRGRDLVLSDVDPEPASGQLASRGGTLCAARFRIKGEFLDHRIELLLTADLARLMTEGRNRRQDGELNGVFLEGLGQIPVRIRGVVDGVTLRLTDIERIQEGSVLQLGVPESAPIGVLTNDLLVARGTIRSSGGRRVVEISHFVREPSVQPAPREQGVKS